MPRQPRIDHRWRTLSSVRAMLLHIDILIDQVETDIGEQAVRGGWRLDRIAGKDAGEDRFGFDIEGRECPSARIGGASRLNWPVSSAGRRSLPHAEDLHGPEICHEVSARQIRVWK